MPAHRHCDPPAPGVASPRMDVPAPTLPGAPAGRYSAEQYLRLVDDGVLGPDDRVELLEGVVVAMAA